MSNKIARFSVIGMMCVITSLAFAGCLAQEGDEFTSDENTSEASQAIVIDLRNVTCNSGWPGTRGCHWVFFSSTDIVPNTITVQINGNNGEIGHTASQTGTRQIDFTASVREGDAFNPGKNSTAYTVAWVRN